MTPTRDQRVIVFGGTRGLGRALAGRLAGRGAPVLVASRSAHSVLAAVDELSVAGPGTATADRPLGARCDITDPADVQAVFATAEREWGGVDAVVTTAGVLGPAGPTERVDWAAWRAAVETNLFGPVLIARAALPLLRAARRGKLVFLSGGGATRALPGMSSYCAAKAGLVRLVETLAAELRDSRVDVNAVAPGPLATDMLAEVEAAGPDAVGTDYHDQVVRWRRDGATPLSTPVGLIEFLLSPAADGVRGRLLSALWDPWTDPAELAAALRDDDLFTLRRVDYAPARSTR